MACIFATKRKYKKAIDCYKKALRLDPKDLHTRARLANTLVSAGNTDEAAQVFCSLGETYERDGQVSKAMAAYKVLSGLGENKWVAAKIKQLETVKHVCCEIDVEGWLVTSEPNPRFEGDDLIIEIKDLGDL